MGQIANSLTSIAFLRQNRRIRQAIERQGNRSADWHDGYRKGFEAGQRAILTALDQPRKNRDHDRD